MSRAVCIICDNGEESLTECVKSLREQTFKARIVIAAGPKTDVEIARWLADKVYQPITGIGRARVNAIYHEDAEYIICCDSDSKYDYRYVEYAVENLKAYRAVKAGTIIPMELNAISIIESAFSILIPYEYALAFRKNEALNAGLIFEAERNSDPRWDIGWIIAERLNPKIEFRMKVYTRMPTYGARMMAEEYIPSMMIGATPIATLTAIIGVREIYGKFKAE